MKNAASWSVATVALFLSVVSQAQTAADTAPAGVAPQDLLDLAATVKAQKEIIEAQRAMLSTQIGANVALPTGAAERVDNVILPSAARFVAYDATRQIAQAICDDLKDRKLLHSSDNYRSMREQRLAIEGQLDQLLDRIAEASKLLGKVISPPTGTGTQVQIAGVTAAAGVLLALDAVGSVGKAIAGLAGFFKTERKIGSVEAVVDEGTVALAMRSCQGNTVTLWNPSDVTLSGVKVDKVDDLRKQANGLRDLISSVGAKLTEKKNAVLKATQELAEVADEKDKPGKVTALKSAEEAVSNIESPLRIATAILAAADTALDKLYAVADGSGISPIVVLARMYAIEVELKKDPEILTLRVLHSSGSSQISRAWWRNDRLYFGGGVAVSYTVFKLTGEVTGHNMYYYQTPWRRFQEEEGTAVTGMRAFTPGKQP